MISILFSNLIMAETYHMTEHSTSWTASWSSTAAYSASVGYAAALGWVMGGWKGASLGAGLAAVDESYIASGTWAKHNLSLGALSSVLAFRSLSSTADVLGYPSGLLPMIGTAALIPWMVYGINDFLDFKASFMMPVDAFSTINRLFDVEHRLSCDRLWADVQLLWQAPLQGLAQVYQDIQAVVHNPFLMHSLGANTLAVGHVFFNHWYMKRLGASIWDPGKAIFRHYLNGADQSQPTSLEPIGPFVLKHTAQIVAGIAAKYAISDILDGLQKYWADHQSHLAIQQANQILLESDRARAIANHPDGIKLVETLNHDLIILSHTAAAQTQSLTKVIIDSLVGFHRLYKGYAEIPFWQWLSLSVLHPCREALIEPIQANAQEWAQHKQDARVFNHDRSVNFNAIHLRGAQAYMVFQQKQLMESAARIQQTEAYGATLQRLLQHAQDTSKHIFTIGVQLHRYLEASPQAAFDKEQFLEDMVSQYFLMHASIGHLDQFFSRNLNIASKNQAAPIAKQHVEQFIDIIFSEPGSGVQRTCHQGNWLSVEDYDLWVNDRLILHIDHLNLQMGQHYAITGLAGVGKSTFMMDLQWGIGGDLKSTGTFGYPYDAHGHPPGLFFINQDTYWPEHASWMQVLGFPQIFEALSLQQQAAFQQKAIDLLQALHVFSAEDAGLSIDWPAFLAAPIPQLSGGQVKKIALIQAILNQPDILILDETFAGLDPQSVRLAIQALQTHLPDVLMLSIDHQASANNDFNHYAFAIQFQNQTVDCQRMGAPDELASPCADVWLRADENASDLWDMPEAVCSMWDVLSI